MSGSHTEPQTFLDVYNLTIAPKLKELDIFLKEKEVPITIWQTSQLLEMPYNEVAELVHKMKIEKIDYVNIFSLILAGTSSLCRLIQKETERGFPFYYTPEDISFIYEIDLEKIESLFEALGIEKIKGDYLAFVFDLLPAGNYYSGK